MTARNLYNIPPVLTNPFNPPVPQLHVLLRRSGSSDAALARFFLMIEPLTMCTPWTWKVFELTSLTSLSPAYPTPDSRYVRPPRAASYGCPPGGVYSKVRDLVIKITGGSCTRDL